MATLVNKFTGYMQRQLFPNYCVFCGLQSGRRAALCPGCELELPRNRHCCACCAIPLPEREGITGRLCGDCQKVPPPFQRARVPWIYDPWFACLIQRWKYHGDQGLTGLLASLWLRGCEHTEGVDLLVPVPLHWRRRWHRGFNQAEVFAREIGRQRTGLGAVETKLVSRPLATAPQSAMSARSRRANIRAAFTVRERCDNLRIAIVDDVLTTGATASSMAAALQDAGATHIEVWCIARTPSPLS